MKKLLKLLLVSIFLINGISTSIYTKKTNEKICENACYKLHDLIDDFKNYITTNVGFHDGDLYQHSIWTALIVDKWFKDHESWTNGLDRRDRELAVLAALLHDIGKSGDLDFTFYTKPGHEIKGLEYLLGKKTFDLAHDKVFNFVKFFKDLGISKDEVKIISILVGCHNQLGILLKKLPKKIKKLDELSKFKSDIQNFFISIHNVLVMADYKKKIDSKLLKLIILICLADVKGSKKVDLIKPLKIFDLTIEKSPDFVHSGCPDNFAKFGYDTRGRKICEFLLDFEK